MSAIVRTQECYPTGLQIGDWINSPAPEPRHEKCSGGYTTPGLIGGWSCPCPCHHRQPVAPDTEGESDADD